MNADSFYVTFDQGGNIYKWNERVPGTSGRGLRGRSWSDFLISLRSSSPSYFAAERTGYNFGFRVASQAPIPEPRIYGAAVGGLVFTVVMIDVGKRSEALKFNYP